MAITLHLSDDDAAGLQSRADADGVSLQQAAMAAIRAYTGDHASRVRHALTRVIEEDAELLERLSR